MPIKVLHVNYSDEGGAAEAASNLHLEMLRQNVKSHFLALNLTKDHQVENNVFSHRRIYLSFFRKLWYLYFKSFFINKRTSRLFKENSNFEEIITLPYSAFDLTLDPLVIEADVIHFHFVSGFIDYPSFFKKNKKPIVWTLHDRNPFSGISHCESNFPIESRRTEERFKKLKKQWISNGNLTIVSPSVEYKNAGMNSGQFGEKTIRTISHGINNSDFYPIDKLVARQKHTISEKEFIIVSVASDLNRKLKGFEEIIEFAKVKTGIHFIFIGKEHNSINLPNIQFTGEINDKSVLNEFYNLADFVLSNSKEESFGLTIAEATMGNNPVLCRKTGVAKEIVNNKLIQTFSSFESLNIDEATQVANSRTDKDYQEILTKFSLSKNTSEYVELYKSLIDDK
jgi:glycosyltransferase involved in cell wall biosynthesis